MWVLYEQQKERKTVFIVIYGVTRFCDFVSFKRGLLLTIVVNSQVVPIFGVLTGEVTYHDSPPLILFRLSGLEISGMGRYSSPKPLTGIHLYYLRNSVKNKRFFFESLKIKTISNSQLKNKKQHLKAQILRISFLFRCISSRFQDTPFLVSIVKQPKGST